MLDAPTRERRQHDRFEPPQIDERAFRPSWRTVDRLELLHRAGLLTAHELRAGERFRAIYENAHRGETGIMRWDGIARDAHCRASGEVLAESKLRALTRLKRIAAALGALFILAVWVAVEGRSWREIGRRLGVCPSTARKWCAATISALAAL